MLVIVSNENTRTVVSLSLIWQITHGDGTSRRHWGHTSFPEMICGDAVLRDQPTGLETGQRRIEADGLVINGWGVLDEYYDQYLGQFVEQKEALLRDAIDLTIELNAVIFADGTLVGPDDDSQLTDLFSAYLRAKQDWYRGIIEALDAGQSVADSFAPVERFLADAASRIRAGIATSPGDLWIHQAAAEARGWRSRYADEAIPRVLKKAIRLEPFNIHR